MPLPFVPPRPACLLHLRMRRSLTRDEGLPATASRGVLARSPLPLQKGADCRSGVFSGSVSYDTEDYACTIPIPPEQLVRQTKTIGSSPVSERIRCARLRTDAPTPSRAMQGIRTNTASATRSRHRPRLGSDPSVGCLTDVMVVPAWSLRRLTLSGSHRPGGGRAVPPGTDCRQRWPRETGWKARPPNHSCC